MLQATLNGGLTKHDHPAVPISMDELVADAVACLDAGAQAFHLHPRDADGAETLEPQIVNAVVGAVRDRCGVPVGVTTGQWIEPDLNRRLEHIRGWRNPDYASVNVSEDGSESVLRELMLRGIGIEAGVWSVADAERLADSGVGNDVLRIMIEPTVEVANALELVRAIHRALDDRGLTQPSRLQHGDGEATWVLLRDAFEQGLDTRIGLEDTFYGPDGAFAVSNAELVTLAKAQPPGP